MTRLVDGQYLCDIVHRKGDTFKSTQGAYEQSNSCLLALVFYKKLKVHRIGPIPNSILGHRFAAGALPGVTESLVGPWPRTVLGPSRMRECEYPWFYHGLDVLIRRGIYLRTVFRVAQTLNRQILINMGV